MRVEQVRGAVQRNRGLAGARPALDDQHAVHRAADDLVLLALDRGDDVVHATGAVALERGEQRAGADHLDVGRLGGNASALKTSSSIASMIWPWHEKWRRRARPIGWRPVAR